MQPPLPVFDGRTRAREVIQNHAADPEKEKPAEPAPQGCQGRQHSRNASLYISYVIHHVRLTFLPQASSEDLH